MTTQLRPGVKGLLVANIVAFVPSLFPATSAAYEMIFALRPSAAIGQFMIWQVVTYAFLHAGMYHFLFNMLGLYMFGSDVEEELGTQRFLRFYFLAAAGSGVLSIPFFWNGAVVGASGAILGLLYVWAKFFPHRQILLFFFVPVSAMTAVWVFGLLSFFGAISASGGNIAHLTHLAGLAIGWAYWRHSVRQEPIPFVTKGREGSTSFSGLHRPRPSKAEYYEKMVDPILKKVSEQGLHSLSKKEKGILEKAREYREASE